MGSDLDTNVSGRFNALSIDSSDNLYFVGAYDGAEYGRYLRRSGADGTWGSSDKVPVTATGDVVSEWTTVTLDSQHRAVVAGIMRGGGQLVLYLRRYWPTGTVDIDATVPGYEANGVAVDSEDNIYVAGTRWRYAVAQSDGAILRYLADGTPGQSLLVPPNPACDPVAAYAEERGLAFDSAGELWLSGAQCGWVGIVQSVTASSLAVRDT